MADAADSKSAGAQAPCRFESDLGHHPSSILSRRRRIYGGAAAPEILRSLRSLRIEFGRFESDLGHHPSFILSRRRRIYGGAAAPEILRSLRSFLMTPLIRPSATFSPQAGRRTLREIPRPAKRGEGAAKRRVRGVITASSARCAVRGLRMTAGQVAER